MKKWVKVVIIIISVLIAVVIAGGTILYFTSSKYQIEHKNIVRAYIYHNELGRELYVLTEEQTEHLSSIIDKAQIGGMINDYEIPDGGPWFSIFCELKGGRTVQLYSEGVNWLIDSVPFKVDAQSAEELLSLHNEIEDEILPISPELLEEIMNKRT